jgi:hypothetical protein
VIVVLPGEDDRTDIHNGNFGGFPMVAVPEPVPVSAWPERAGTSCGSGPGGPISSPFEPAAWPLSSHLELGALDSAVPCARLHARQVVREWGRPDLADSTELLVSELMTNAIRASIDVTNPFHPSTTGPEHVDSHEEDEKGSPSPAVTLWLFSDGRCLVIQVGDGSSEMPLRQDADADSESGWGLLLVESLSQDWGSFPRANGKVVWARI